MAVVGDWWTLLLLRELASGRHRFSELVRELGVSRRVLTERLADLVDHGVVERRRYQDHPPRDEYHLTEKGLGLVPVLVALQDWGGRYLLGDGSLTATTPTRSAEARRVHELVGRPIPSTQLVSCRNQAVDPAGGAEWTVLYCFPGGWAPAAPGHPPGWDGIPGARGCTVESTTFRDLFGQFAGRGAQVYGVSTQRPDQLADFASHYRLPFSLLSDQELQFTAALRLPVFRAGGVDRLKRLSLIADESRTIRAVLYPIHDPAGSVADALARIDELRGIDQERSMQARRGRRR